MGISLGAVGSGGVGSSIARLSALPGTLPHGVWLECERMLVTLEQGQNCRHQHQGETEGSTRIWVTDRTIR